MQGNPTGQGSNQNNKPGGLSWSMPSSSATTGSQSAKPVAPAAPTARPASTPPITKAQIKADTNQSRGWGMFAAGVIVGALVMWGWTGFDTTGTSPNATSTPTGSGATNTAGRGNGTGTIGSTGATTQNTGSAGQTNSGTASSNAIEVGNQDAGMSVVIADATVSQPTWLVVYELYQGKPVRALGATMFFPEYNGKGGIISLLRATQPRTTYFVGQSLDTGTHTFTPHVNQEVRDSSGAMIGSTFTTR